MPEIDLCIFFTLSSLSALLTHPFMPLDYQNQIKNRRFMLVLAAQFLLTQVWAHLRQRYIEISKQNTIFGLVQPQASARTPIDP